MGCGSAGDCRTSEKSCITSSASSARHPKLKEIIVQDFSDLSALKDELVQYNACFFCLGTTSLGKPEANYKKITYDLTIGFAKTLSEINPDITFCYVSGSGTDSSEQGKIMWARVKGKTENDLQKLPFKAEYNFRPGYLHPAPGQNNTLSYYKYITWAYPFLRRFAPNHVSTLKELALAMINAAHKGYPKAILEVRDIVELSKVR